MTAKQVEEEGGRFGDQRVIEGHVTTLRIDLSNC